MKIDVGESFPFTTEQAAMLSGVSVRTLQRALERYDKDPGDRYALRYEQSGPRGRIAIKAVDLMDYWHRRSVKGV